MGRTQGEGQCLLRAWRTEGTMGPRPPGQDAAQWMIVRNGTYTPVLVPEVLTPFAPIVPSA